MTRYVLLMTAILCDLSAADCSVELIKGEEVVANLAGLEDGRLVLKKTEVDIALGDIVRVKWNSGKPQIATKADVILLKSGDTLRGTILKFDGKDVFVKSLVYGTVEISSTHILGGGFFHPFKFVRPERKEISEEEDRLFLSNGDTLGVTLLSITATSVIVKSQLGVLELPRNSLRWFSFAFAPRGPDMKDGILVSTQTTSGDTISGKILGIDEESVTLQAEYEKFTFMQNQLLELRVNNGGVIYLSDLEPIKVEEIPFFSTISHYRNDKSIGGATIRLRGKRFEKGLGVHSRTLLTYSLNGEYSRFKAVVGIDDEAKGKGNTIFRVFGDEALLYESRDLTGSSIAENVDLGVSGVEKIVLEVDYGKEFHIGDRAVWADARLIR